MPDYRTGPLPWECGGEAHLRERVHDAGRCSHREVRERRERERLRFLPRAGLPGAGRRAAQPGPPVPAGRGSRPNSREPAAKPPGGPPREPPGVLRLPEPGAEDRTRPAAWPAAATPPRRDAPTPRRPKPRDSPIAPQPPSAAPPRHQPGRLPCPPVTRPTRHNCPSHPRQEHRCHIDVPLSPPPRTSMWHRGSPANSAATSMSPLNRPGEHRCGNDVHPRRRHPGLTSRGPTTRPARDPART